MLNKTRSQGSYRLHSSRIDFSTGELHSPLETQNYFIVQIVDTYMTRSETIRAHRQFCDIEITYVRRNSMTCSTNNTDCKVAKNDCYLSIRDDEHSLFTLSGCRFQTVAFNIKPDSPCAKLMDMIRADYGASDRRLFKELYIDNELNDIIDSVNNESPLYPIICDAGITRILTKLCEYKLIERFSEERITSKDLLPEIILYIDNNLLNIRSLTDLTDVFGYTYGYLCRIFKMQYGIGIQKYLISKKMDYAKKELKNNVSITEISERLGYSSPFNFSNAFKKHFGISPNKWQK